METGDTRVVLYDPKGDFRKILHELGARCPVKTLFPLAADGVAWKICVDCADPATAKQIASVFIPVAKADGEDKAAAYFTKAARHLLSGVLISLIEDRRRRGTDWDLRDVILAMQNTWAMEQLLAREPSTRNRLKYLHQGEPTTPNILTTMETFLEPFEEVAALWDHATESISLEEFLTREQSVLLLRDDESLKDALDPLTRAIFKRLRKRGRSGTSWTRPARRVTWTTSAARSTRYAPRAALWS